jgi:cell wall-associated NlpC family hydrolase
MAHATEDRSWYFVETAHVFGWVRADDLAFVSDHQAARITALPLAAITRDRVAVKDRAERFLFQARIGMLLPVLETGSRSATCLVLGADENRHAVIRKVELDRSWAETFPLLAAPANCALIASQFPGEAYGWGGLFQNRDCSAFIRDYLTPFGIWMPRNSAQQARMGRFIDLEGASPRDRERVIADQGVPFLSLVAMPGHIMLYIGSSRGSPLVQHTMWGLRTKGFLGGEGRLVVGQNVISDLKPGRSVPNLSRPGGELLHRITGMALLDTGVTEWPSAPFRAAVECPDKSDAIEPDTAVSSASRVSGCWSSMPEQAGMRAERHSRPALEGSRRGMDLIQPD